MDNRELVIGGFYKHFKNKMYQVRGVAHHSETKEKMVVYQALYGDFGLYVRPYDMFMSEVDHVKYPDVLQKYRFEQVNPDGTAIDIENDNKRNPIKDLDHFEQKQTVQTEQTEQTKQTEQREQALQTEKTVQAEQSLQAEQTNQEQVRIQVADGEIEEGKIDEGLLMFLDADNYQEKLNTLTLLRDKLDDNMINTMAASMDVEVVDGPMEMRYNSLRNCILAHAKYECTRLR